MSLYSYEGRLLATPRWPAPAISYDMLNRSQISLASDIIALRDHTDDKGTL